jgi:hypothetical protein
MVNATSPQAASAIDAHKDAALVPTNVFQIADENERDDKSYTHIRIP